MSGYTGIVDASPGFVTGTFDARDVRIAAIGNQLPGLFQPGDFEVTQRAAGANQSVDIAAGRAYVDPGYTLGGSYVAQMLTSYNTSSDGGYTWTASDPTNPRIDLLCIEVSDTDMGGSYNGWKFRIVDGTPNASASHALETAYWPAVPTGCVPIAAIRRAASATTIATADIVNLNPIGGSGRSPSKYISAAETTASASYARLATPDFVCVYVPANSSRIKLGYKAQWKVSVASGTQAVAWFINNAQLKYPAGSGVPVVAEYGQTLSTAYGHLATSLANSSTASLSFITAASGGDVSDVTTGMLLWVYNGSANYIADTIDVWGLPAGWYIIEPKFKTTANTITVRERRVWAEVIG